MAGIVANYLAENLGFGPRAPFGLAIICFIFCFFIVASTWTENYGNQVYILRTYEANEI